MVTAGGGGGGKERDKLIQTDALARTTFIRRDSLILPGHHKFNNALDWIAWHSKLCISLHLIATLDCSF